MKSHENMPSDEQLDELLRQVEVPQDLKANLYQLPQTDNSSIAQPAPRYIDVRKKRWPGLLLLAATLLGISAFFAWPFLAPSSPIELVKKHPPLQNQVLPISDSDAFGMLEQVNDLLDQAELRLAQLKVDGLESQLQDMHSTSQNRLALEQYTSMILALADQTVVDLGGSQQSAQANMVSVISKFPDSAGARIAQQYLDQIPN